MLASSVYPPSRAFSRNPILLSVATSSVASFRVYDVTSSSSPQLLFTGHGEDEFTANLAEIADALLPEMPLEYGENVVESLAGLGLQRALRIDLANQEGDTASHSVSVIKGGVTLRAYRELRSLGSDAFTTRYANYKGCFFLSVRAKSWMLPVSEAELAPLPFIAPDGLLQIREAHTGCLFTPQQLSPGVLHLLHLDRLRRYFFNQYHVLPSLFDIIVGGQEACRIAVTRARHLPWAPVVRWSDACGAWSRLQLAPPAAAGWRVSEALTYMQYLSPSDSFALRNGRRPVALSFSVPSGPLRPYEMDLVADVMASDAVFLSLPGLDGELRVVPEVQEWQSAVRATQPQSVSFSFKVTEEDEFQQLFTCQAEPPAIHSAQFDKTFN